VRCGRCGALLHLHYSGPQGEFPEYRCSADQSQFGGTDCQRGRALALDRQIEQRFLEALHPDQVTLALAALAQLEQEEQAETKQWELRLERARSQAKRAERQYQAVEPENRLVARSLEKQWEERFRAVESVEKEYHACKSSRLGTFTQADREAVVALGSDLPAHGPRIYHDEYGAQADGAPGDSRGHCGELASRRPGLGANQLANGGAGAVLLPTPSEQLRRLYWYPGA